MFTIIIPVRGGSTRCPNKNNRKFGDTSLLKKKIEELSPLLSMNVNIKEIIVSTEDTEMLNTVKKYNENNNKIRGIERNPWYSRSETTPNEIFYYLSTLINTKYMIYCHCVSPFSSVNLDNIIEMIKITKEKIETENYSSIVSAYSIKKHLWNNKMKPINFDLQNMKKTQDLDDIFIPSYSFNIIPTIFVRNNHNIFGNTPYFFKFNEIESIDIDTPFEFKLSELLYNNNINTLDDINLTENNNYNLLDCTIRDGGYTNNWNFSLEEVMNIYKSVSDANYEYCEIGFRTNKNIIKGKGDWYYTTEDMLNNIKYNGCKIAVLTKMNEVDVEKDFLHDANKSKIDLIRVYIPRLNEDKKFKYSNKILKNNNNFIKKLINYGYNISINFGNTCQITDDECKNIFNIFKETFKNKKIKFIYLVDTYGVFNDKLILQKYNMIMKYIKKYNYNHIQIGGHFHNNKLDSVNKCITGIECGINLIDTCINSLGRGAGNVNSLDLLMELNDTKFNINPILTCTTDFDYKVNYNKLYYLTAKLNIHPNYVIDIIKNNINIENGYKILYKISNFNKCNNINYYSTQIFNNFYK